MLHNLKKEENAWEHILLLGCDSQIIGEYERADSIIIASFNYTKSVVKLTSVMRDIWLDIPGCGEGKINSVVVRGGPRLAMQVIGRAFGLSIRYYAMINMEGLVRIFDSLGGIDISVDERELDFINENTIDVQRIIQDESVIEPIKNSGQVHLCGAQIMAHMRNRRHGYDYARTARQREVLGIAIKKIKTNISIKTLKDLALCARRQIKYNISVYKLFELFSVIRKANMEQIETFRIPAKGTYKERNDKIWRIEIDFQRNEQLLKNFLESSSSKPSVQQMNTIGGGASQAELKVNPSYKKWKQTDAVFNEKQAWPVSLFPDAEYRYFSECGSFVTALSIMLRHYNIEKQTDPNKFNPWVLNERFIKCGAFTEAADLVVKNINLLYNLEYFGSVPYSRERLVQEYKSGEPFLITVSGVNAPRHCIVPELLTENDLKIIDSASEKSFLSEYESIFELLLFRRVCLDRKNPMIALTFDDGPGYKNETDLILDALEKYHAKATFFTVGNRLLRRPESLKRKLEMGCEIGSHTWNHEHYGKTVTKEDVLKCNEIIKNVTGQCSTCFRSPGGVTNPYIRQVCKEVGLPLFHWSIDTNDWKWRDATRLYDEIIGRAQDGDIVLMHEIYESTAQGLEAVLKALSERGFQFVTCSELVLAKTGKPPEPGIQYWKSGIIFNDTT